MSKITKVQFNQALRNLEMDILIGVYKPRERLIESEMLEKYGVTRNAVRNMFKELQIKGLIKHIPNRGVLVAELDTKEANELYSIRVLLENHALDLVARHLNDSSLDRIIQINQEFEDAVDRNDFHSMVNTNVDFHQEIFKVSGNSILTDMIHQLRNRALNIRHYVWLQPGQVRKSVEDHRTIIQMLKNRDAKGLRKNNRSHMLAAYELYTGKKFRSNGKITNFTI